MQKVVCFTDEYDTQEIKNAKVDAAFIDTFDELTKTDANIYIVSLRKASNIYNKFVAFMRENPTRKFLFLEEYHLPLTNEDFDIRDEPNTDIYMYTPDKAMFLAGLID